MDVLLANIAGRVTAGSDEPPPVSEEERSHAIQERDNLFIAAGTRITGYFGDNLIQFRTGMRAMVRLAALALAASLPLSKN